MNNEQSPQSEAHGDPLAEPLAFWAVVGTLLVVTAIISLIALYDYTEQSLTEQRVYDAPDLAVELLHAEQDGKLSTPHWVDRDADLVQIPIDDAIRLTARELRASADGTGPWSPRGGPAASNENAQPANADDPGAVSLPPEQP